MLESNCEAFSQGGLCAVYAESQGSELGFQETGLNASTKWRSGPESPCVKALLALRPRHRVWTVAGLGLLLL